MTRRLKRPPSQLDLFGGGGLEPVPPPESSPPPRPFPVTAADAPRVLRLGFNDYAGFVTQEGRVVCRACLDRLGSQRALAGDKFLRYLWPPDLGDSLFQVRLCSRCGMSFSVEPAASSGA